VLSIHNYHRGSHLNAAGASINNETVFYLGLFGVKSSSKTRTCITYTIYISPTPNISTQYAPPNIKSLTATYTHINFKFHYGTVPKNLGQVRFHQGFLVRLINKNYGESRSV